jgi:hypothetical protein
MINSFELAVFRTIRWFVCEALIIIFAGSRVKKFTRNIPL